MLKVDLKLTQDQRKFLHYLLYDDTIELIGFGGARGGGKTYVSCLGMCLRRLIFPNTRGLMLRVTQGAADQNLGEEIRKILRSFNFPIGKEKGGAYWHVADKQWHFPNGSYIQLGYCKGVNDWERYQGNEYMDIAFEEATQFKERAFLDITGSNRQTEHVAVSKAWATTNPGGIGTSWVLARIINPETREPRTVYIKSLLANNQAMLEKDPGYRDRVIARQPEWRQRQWEDGDWDSVEGQFFVINPEKTIIPNVEIPYWADWYAGTDAGFFPSAFAACYMARWKDANGDRIHITHEIKRHRLNASQQADEAVTLEKIHLPKRVKARFADPNSWKRSETNVGTNAVTATLWAREGYVVSPAFTNARAAGWLLLRTLLDSGNLTIDPRCVALIKELNEAVHDPKTEDIHTDCEDHLLDALRYAIVSIFNSMVPKQPKKKKSQAEKEMRILKIEKG